MTSTLLIWAAIISAAAAVMAAWLSARANRIAQRSLELAQNQDARRMPNLELYLVNAYFKRVDGRKGRVYVFRIRVSNRSEADNSIRAAELSIVSVEGEADTRKGVNVNIRLSHDPHLVSLLDETTHETLNIPAKIGAYETLEGFLLFHISESLLNRMTVDAYHLEVVDAQGLASHIQAIVVIEAKHEP